MPRLTTKRREKCDQKGAAHEVSAVRLATLLASCGRGRQGVPPKNIGS